MPAHESRMCFIQKIIIVTSVITQLYCVKNLSVNPHYQINRDHVHFLIQQIERNDIDYTFLPLSSSHFLSDIVIINEYTPNYQRFKGLINRIDFDHSAKK